MKKTYEELEEEVIQLRKKLSPLVDAEFTKTVAYRMRGVDLLKFKRKFRGAEYVVLYPKDLYELLFKEEPTNRDITELGRSLQALFWERSAISGNLCFVMEVPEYEKSKAAQAKPSP